MKVLLAFVHRRGSLDANVAILLSPFSEKTEEEKWRGMWKVRVEESEERVSWCAYEDEGRAGGSDGGGREPPDGEGFWPSSRDRGNIKSQRW